jgi:predicted nucleic-acid-binding protein
MAGLDTNVLVRWLVDDDPVQTACVRSLFESAKASNEMFYVPLTVMLELEWVLRSRYKYTKPEVLTTFNVLLETQELALENESVVEGALHLFRHGSAGFADCLHASQCSVAGQSPMLTFDVKAAKLEGVQRLEA